mmetsp:Transcript_60385/g.174877  ORF Transcript_60385/g.174877 Transcript_60385/m.174877 type:complete len:227 (+) Transcript_60385:2624-3304(+)
MRRHAPTWSDFSTSPFRTMRSRPPTWPLRARRPAPARPRGRPRRHCRAPAGTRIAPPRAAAKACAAKRSTTGGQAAPLSPTRRPATTASSASCRLTPRRPTSDAKAPSAWSWRSTAPRCRAAGCAGRRSCWTTATTTASPAGSWARRARSGSGYPPLARPAASAGRCWVACLASPPPSSRPSSAGSAAAGCCCPARCGSAASMPSRLRSCGWTRSRWAIAARGRCP